MMRLCIKCHANTFFQLFPDACHRFISKVINFKNDRVVQYFNNTTNPFSQNTISINDQFYSDEKALKTYFSKERLEFYQDVGAFLKKRKIPLNGKTILDAGCGTGHLLLLILKLYPSSKVEGFDFSISAIRYAKKLVKNGTFYVYNVYNRFPNTYDCILCTEVIEHLKYPTKAIRNLISSLQMSGTCIITVPNGRIDTLEEHINFWSPESWKVYLHEIIDNRICTIQTGFLTKKTLYAIIRKRNI